MGAICDEKTVELLELVSQYEQLCNDKLRTDFIDGFFTLGRANYNSGSVKKYGVDSLDMRPHEPGITVEVGDQMRVKKDEVITKKIQKDGIITKKVQKDEIMNDDNESRELENDDNSEKSTLRNRKNPEKTTSNTIPSTKETKQPEKPSFNPLLQFGGLVPYQLRQSQLHFTAAIELAVERYNLAARIEKLVKELESNESN